MPSNGFAFSIRVSCEQNFVSTLDCLGQHVDVFGVALHQLVLHGEGVFRVDGAGFRNQIAHVAIGRNDFKAVAEVFLQRLGFGG